MRGRLFLADVRDATALTDVCDVLTVIAMDTPGEALGKWRTGLDRAVATAQTQTTTGRPDRATWGLQPGQIEAHRKFLERTGGG